MKNSEICKLDMIIKNINNSITKSISEILEMTTLAKKDYKKLEVEFRTLKVAATNAIEKVNQIENKLYNCSTHKNNLKKIDNFKKNLAIEKEREHNLIQRRNEVEIHLRTISNIINKAEKLEKDLQIVINLLDGNLRSITSKLGNIHSQDILGIKILEAREIERQRISREMHDGPAQTLTNLMHKTELCIKLIDKDKIRTRLELQSLKNVVRTTINDTRRIIYNLRPMSIDDLGLIPTLERYIETIQEEETFKIILNVINEEYQVKPIINLTLFRIVQEAINNIKKHANAKQVVINVIYKENLIELKVTDDGIGFNIELIENKKEINRGFGLSIMKERINLLSGYIKIESNINNGTTYIIKVPIIQNKEENDDRNIDC